MKKLLIILCLIYCSAVNAAVPIDSRYEGNVPMWEWIHKIFSPTVVTNYYVDPSSGGTNSGTLSNPWHSLSDINQSTFNAGDFVLFKRGESIPGRLQITKGGTIGNVITYGAYGTGSRPKLIGTGSTINYLFYINGPDYITFTDIDVTDPTLNSSDPTRAELSKIQRVFWVDLNSNHIICQDMDMELIGVGAYWVGSDNLMLRCFIHNMRMLVNTNDGPPPGNDDDYGANAVTIGDGSDNNLVSHCRFTDNWAPSYDYGKDGGPYEIFGSGSSDNNVFEYNFVSDCIGVSEISANTAGLIFRFNIFINNGSFLNFQSGHTHSGTSVYNNVFVFTTTPLTDDHLFYGTTGDVTLINNLFYMRGGFDVGSGSITSHSYNQFDLGVGSTGLTIGTGEANTTIPWISKSGNPTTWDYHVTSAIAGISGGIDGITIDYYSVPGINDYIGVSKFVTVITPPPSTDIHVPFLLVYPGGSTTVGKVIPGN